MGHGHLQHAVHNAAGLDIPALMAHAAQHRTVHGFPGGDPFEPKTIFALDVDILIPAAGPLAHRHLHDRGVLIIPDILANAGGVTTSYFERVQNWHGYYWKEQDVNARLEDKMVEAFADVLDASLRHGVDMRTAAYVVGHRPCREGHSAARDVRLDAGLE